MRFMTDPASNRRRATLIGAGVVALLLVAVIASAVMVNRYRQHEVASRLAPSPKPVASISPQPSGSPGAGLPRPLVLTYYYYWYNQDTGQHLGPNDALPTHPTSPPDVSWQNVSWHKKQLADMPAAGIDVALPVYWGYGSDQQWSTEGLRYLVQAREEMVQAGASPPTIGMFFDTSILDKKDLTTAANEAFFYSNLKDFFTRIPSSDWGRYDGRPIVFLFLPQNGNLFNQGLFDYTYQHFEADFKVKPYLVRATGWDCAITAWGASGPTKDCSTPIKTDASFVWGTAQDGYQPAGTVASVGPGYDERLIPGRKGTYVPRADGAWYTTNFDKAIASGKRMLAIETWNELHEASGIGETKEYGRVYIDLTKQLTDAYRKKLGGTLDPQQPAGA